MKDVSEKELAWAIDSVDRIIDTIKMVESTERDEGRGNSNIPLEGFSNAQYTIRNHVKMLYSAAIREEEKEEGCGE